MNRKVLAVLVIACIWLMSGLAIIWLAPSSGAVSNLRRELDIGNSTSQTYQANYTTTTSESLATSTESLTSYFTSSTTLSTSTTKISSTSEAIDSAWVSSFVSSVNAVRDQKGLSNLTYASILSQFAKIRYNTMVTDYEISHYGYTADFQEYMYNQVSLEVEEVLFPAGFAPSAYLSNLQTNGPIHYGALLTSSLSNYGFYIASGPVYQVSGPCPVTEIPGPNINITQYYDQYGCSFTIVNSTWFVLELSS